MTKIIKILLSLLALTTYSLAEDVTQTNVNGGNTSISGGMTTATTYESGSSSNSTTTSNSTSNIRSAPPSAFAPSVNSSGIDICSTGASAGVQTFGFGISGGGSFKDENCERIKLSRQLDSMGMKVASVALLCQDERVFFAMEQAGTPCPLVLGPLGSPFIAMVQPLKRAARDNWLRLVCEGQRTAPHGSDSLPIRGRPNTLTGLFCAPLPQPF